MIPASHSLQLSSLNCCQISDWLNLHMTDLINDWTQHKVASLGISVVCFFFFHISFLIFRKSSQRKDFSWWVCISFSFTEGVLSYSFSEETSYSFNWHLQSFLNIKFFVIQEIYSHCRKIRKIYRIHIQLYRIYRKHRMAKIKKNYPSFYLVHKIAFILCVFLMYFLCEWAYKQLT